MSVFLELVFKTRFLLFDVQSYFVLSELLNTHVGSNKYIFSKLDFENTIFIPQDSEVTYPNHLNAFCCSLKSYSSPLGI